MPPKTKKKKTPAVSSVKRGQQPPEGETKDESNSTPPSLLGQLSVRMIMGPMYMAQMTTDLIGITDLLNRIRYEVLHAIIHKRKPKRPRRPRGKTLILPDERTIIPNYRAFCKAHAADTLAPSSFLGSLNPTRRKTRSRPSTRREKQIPKKPYRIPGGSEKRALSPPEDLVSETPALKRRRLDSDSPLL